MEYYFVKIYQTTSADTDGEGLRYPEETVSRRENGTIVQ
jgi:hypothetical protein